MADWLLQIRETWTALTFEALSCKRRAFMTSSFLLQPPQAVSSQRYLANTSAPIL